MTGRIGSTAGKASWAQLRVARVASTEDGGTLYGCGELSAQENTDDDGRRWGTHENGPARALLRRQGKSSRAGRRTIAAFPSGRGPAAAVAQTRRGLMMAKFWRLVMGTMIVLVLANVLYLCLAAAQLCA